MYPPFEYDLINQRRDELWRLADEARLAAKARGRSSRPDGTPAWRLAIGSALIRAGHAFGGRDHLRSASREC
ncbi:MAG TPA: hypothetical protein VGB64_12300 [Actinomycetota bacterium]